MHHLLFLSSLLSIGAVQAGVLKRDIAPDTVAPSGPTPTLNIPVQTSAYIAALKLSDSPADSGNVTADSIRLVGFEGCSDMPGITDAIDQIYSGWQQAQKIMAVPAIKDGKVDFNTAGALEYLGAAGLNQPRQADMQAIFKNFGTLTPAWWPFGYRVHVRCDDPAKKCPCGTGAETLAYTTNKDPKYNLARINFCPKYFSQQTLNAAINSGENMRYWMKYDMNRYADTQGHTWAHELMHIDWVTNAKGINGNYGSNTHVGDLKIQYTGTDNLQRVTTAYGPAPAKLLARWPFQTGDYTIRNADNLALFMTSQYVQQQLGNSYPQFPYIKVEQPDVRPWDPKNPFANLFVFKSDGTVALNASNPLAAPFGYPDTPECSTDEDVSDPDTMTFKSFAPDSAYPSSYISSLSAWQASETDAPDPVMTEGPGKIVPNSVAVTPSTTPPPPSPVSSAPPAPKASDICGDWYKVLFDHFEIYGKDFDTAKFGDGGSGLKKQIQGCGDLTNWSFKTLTNDPQGMQWFAEGNLPIGTKACVGRAIVSAGGLDPDGCTGAG